ncbi:MAG: sensor histidine kinase [Rhodocyclales bacterium]|nr:sensor histidine kinase [Rhodocyclales bacterium]
MVSLPARLISLRRGLLLALFTALYVVLWQGPDTLFGRTLFLVHLGLFILWQPFVHTGQRLSLSSLLAVLAVALLAGIYLKGWMITLWIMMLAGVVGGKVLLYDARAARLFYLLALAFLVLALTLLAAPLAVSQAKPPVEIVWLGHVSLVFLLVVMALLPLGQEVDSVREVVDFVYSMFIFLLLTVLMLGSLAAMLLLGSGYVEALLQTLLVTGVVLMLLGLAVNPRSGFAGIGSLISRYLMSIGLPVEQWLQALSNLALAEEDPHAFLEKASVEIAQRLPWVKGGEWIAGGSRGSFGVSSGRRWEFSHGGLVLVLFTQHAPSPTLIWHYNLLAQLLAQFHADKLRAQALRQLSYMRAIHETGARLTHDVKNLLQSLNALCSAGIEPGAEASPEYQSLLRRQLPAITDRLAETLAKLNAPQGGSVLRRVEAREWWREQIQRLAALDWVELRSEGELDGELPMEVYSGVLDNLVRNAAEKHLREPGLKLVLRLGQSPDGFELTATDDGSAIAVAIAAALFIGPVSSESGYGIGLYQAARHAETAGYCLELAENRDGCVSFRLATRPPSPE